MLTSVILIIIAAILVGVYVSWRAGRLDRLHARVEAARPWSGAVRWRSNWPPVACSTRR